MRIATWNVNSLKARLTRVEEWLEYARPDVLCMQETKLADAAFPYGAFATLGYEAAHFGDGRWNGVALASRVGLDDVTLGFGDDTDEQGCRLVAATCGGVRVHSVYVPNGRSVGSEHYEAKLEWLERLRLRLERTCDPAGAAAVCGDFNVAPEDRDVWSPKAFEGETHVTPLERDALGALVSWGLVDAFRLQYDQDGLFTWWDYRAGNFHKRQGLRIDLVLVTKVLAERFRYALMDRNARKGQAPSDHAPVFVDVADA
ncbi:MAG TPA: exodeoxyribonuclease III [Acidimicrobiales bacterium]|nr:exodeoxyribonuclease III [Acidimicrobiales bacterium]